MVVGMIEKAIKRLKELREIANKEWEKTGGKYVARNANQRASSKR